MNPTPTGDSEHRKASPLAELGLSRRTFAGGAAAASALTAVGGWQNVASAHARRKGARLGSAVNAPGLPPAFTKTFKSRYITANGVRHHVVIGGDGPPLLLVHGWPETWYAWRLVMPELAKSYTVIAVDQRGIGLSDKPAGGYDSGNIAKDLASTMAALGHTRFAVAGHDTGMVASYALAADYPDRVARVALMEVPGPPSFKASPPAFLPGVANNKLWHIPFNRIGKTAEQLITGREDIFFGYEFNIQGGTLPQNLVDYYISLVSDPVSLSGSLGFYRDFDGTLAQNDERAKTPLQMPVLAIGGVLGWGTAVGEHLDGLATDIQTVAIPGAGHWVAEQAPAALLAEFTAFFAPYRTAATG
jgi:pimeloyl-ACP methyl ester carboxylesterase